MRQVNCPKCAKQLGVPDTSTDLKVRCRACNHIFVVSPEPQGESSKRGPGIGWPATVGLGVFGVVPAGLLVYVVMALTPQSGAGESSDGARIGAPTASVIADQQGTETKPTPDDTNESVATVRKTEIEDAAKQTEAPAEMTPEQLFRKVSPAVVKIVTKDEDGEPISTGSGFVVSAEGIASFDRTDKNSGSDIASLFWLLEASGQSASLVVTNYHVIRSAVDATVYFSTQHEGSVSQTIAEDESSDVAILLVTSDTEAPCPLRLYAGRRPPVGMRVFTLGSPLGLQNTLSEGLISGYRQRKDGADWIQISAPISPGSSGGPLLAADGSVLGLTSASITAGQNLNFAVPANEIRRLLDAPKHLRALWEGTNIAMEESSHYSTALHSLLRRFRDENPQDSEEPDMRASFKDYRARKEKAGDQLALLLKGRDEHVSRNYASAVGTLTLATRAQPGDYEYLAYHALGRAYYRSSLENKLNRMELDNSIQALKKATELNPSFSPALSGLAETNLMAWHDPEALVAAEFLVRLVPRCSQAYQIRGNVLARLERLDAALQDLRTAIDLRPNYWAIHNDVGSVYSELGECEKAVQEYEVAIRLQSTLSVEVMCMQNMGVAYEKCGQFEEAIAIFVRVLDYWEKNDFSEFWVSNQRRRIADCRAKIR